MEEIVSRLLVAQADRDSEAESICVRAISRHFHPIKIKNRYSGLSKTELFFEKLAFGLSDCWYWRGSVNRLGYGILGRMKAHRVSWALHFGSIPEGMSVLHKCDVRLCVNPGHLFIGTQADNVADMMAKKRNVSIPRYGESNPGSKLNALEVADIRKQFHDGQLSMRQLAAKHSVAVMTIHRAIRGITWSK